MLVRATLVAMAVALLPLSMRPAAAAEIPAEPGAVVLPDAEIMQAVAADLDGDGSRELVRLVRGEADAAFAEVWGLGPDGWQLVDEPIQVLAPARIGPRVDLVYAGVPLRLLVHRVGGVDGVVVATQPRFEEIDSGPACCLMLHRLILEAGELRRVQVAQPTDPVDAILAIDLDGDDTDELLTSLSLPPLGGISYPVEAGVYRWTDGAFGAPTVSELPVGSGDSPFLIGDSDGRPGDEAAYISTLGPPGLYRIVLGPDDVLSLDEFGEVVEDAIGVPLAGSTGIATTRAGVTSVRRWPAFGEPDFLYAVTSESGVLLAVTELAGLQRLLLHDEEEDRLRMLNLPNLTEPRVITATAAARRLSDLPVAPYAGTVPGGGVDGAEAVMAFGAMIPWPEPSSRSEVIDAASLAAAEPVGLVANRDWMAMLHTPHPTAQAAATGGRFDSPTPLPDAWVSIAPLDLVLATEVAGGVLDTELQGAVTLGSSQMIGIGLEGFVASLRAPPGSRVVYSQSGRNVVTTPIRVPTSGQVSVPIEPTVTEGEEPVFGVDLLVMTPAGHGYLEGWRVAVLTGPPRLEVDVSTPFGSPDVTVSGVTNSYASVTVNGEAAGVDPEGRFSARVPLPPWPTDVVVEARDFVGNSARSVVNGVGIFDYRGLPWIPIVVVLLAAAGAVLYLRVPRPVTEPRRIEDDAIFEELEPD